MAARRFDEVTLTFGIRIIARLLFWFAGLDEPRSRMYERRAAIEAAR